MIQVSNAAFGFLRDHKQVEDSVEEFVMRRLNGRCNSKDMLTAFENGISGQYGKVYALDAATLIGWVEKYLGAKNSSKSYLETGLLNPSDKGLEYSNDFWNKEANKCFTAFLNGVNESNFHPCVYDRMMIDGKIKLNACMKYLEHSKTGDYDPALVMAAKQKVLRDCFLTYKSNGWATVYFV